MKLQIIASVAVLLCAGLAQAQDDAPQGTSKESTKLETDKQKGSYGIGHSVGMNITSGGLEVDLDAFLAGLQDALAGKEAKVDQATFDEVMQRLSAAGQERVAARNKKMAEDNKKEGVAFLATNGKKKGVVTLPGGLQYLILKAGTGRSPATTDTVRVHYHGTLIDGTVFDSSVERKEPISFALNQVIKGWTQGVAKMKVGGKWRLFIPADLAYGDTPRPGGPIGPGAALIFDVELLGIEGAPGALPIK